MKPVMYIVANRGLGMSPGKLAAQVAHAAVEAFQVSDQKLVDAWNSGGHYTKIILSADDELQITNINQYIMDRGFKTRVIVDEGRTEIKPFSKTAIGVQIVDKDIEHVVDTFSSFRTYKELEQPIVFGSPEVTRALKYAEQIKMLNRRGKRYLNG